MPKCANLDVYQGDDWSQPVEVFEDENDPPTPLDLTGYTARSQIRTDVADVATEVIAEISVTIQLPNVIVLSLSHDVTALLVQDYIWDLELVDAVGTVSTLMGGEVRVELEVTRAMAAA